MTKFFMQATTTLMGPFFLAPLGRAQDERLSGTVVWWGGQVLPYVEPGTEFTSIEANRNGALGLTKARSIVGWGSSGGRYPLQGVVAIAGSLALKENGEVVWAPSGGEVPLAPQSDVVAIASGDDHHVALKEDGSVVAWGSNDTGQLDVPTEAQSGVVAIAAGGGFRSYSPRTDITTRHGHTVALKSDGAVVAWGDNTWGQTDVPSSAQTGVTAIAAGPWHTVALKSDGSVVAWGDNRLGQTDTPVEAQNGVVAIAAGAFIETSGSELPLVRGYTVALKSDGAVLVWGYNGDGQTEIPSAAQEDVVAITTGSGSVYAFKSDGSTVAWGYNGRGQTTLPGAREVVAIADGMFLRRDGSLEVASGRVPPEAQSGVTAIASRGHYLALREDGSVVGWGDNRYDQATVPPEAEHGVVAIAAGLIHSLAAKEDGSVVAWGGSSWLGETVVPVEAQSGVTAVAAGNGLSAALKSDGSVVAWGDNRNGQTNVPPAAQSDVTAIAAGWYHLLALKRDGSVVAWGAGNWGQTAVPVEAQSGVVAIAAGVDHSVALKNDGSIVTWGGGQVGTGQTVVPPGLPPAIAIDAGYNATTAIVREPPSLRVVRDGERNVKLSWTGFGTLEQTDDLLDWAPAPSQENPQVVPTTDPRKFYRVNSNQ